MPFSHLSLQEFDANYDGRISFDEFNSALGRWVDEKLTSVESAAGGGNGFAGRYSALLDPHGGGPAASLLEDLPPDDLAALQVGCSRGWRGEQKLSAGGSIMGWASLASTDTPAMQLLSWPCCMQLPRPCTACDAPVRASPCHDAAGLAAG